MPYMNKHFSSYRKQFLNFLNFKFFNFSVFQFFKLFIKVLHHVLSELTFITQDLQFRLHVDIKILLHNYQNLIYEEFRLCDMNMHQKILAHCVFPVALTTPSQ